MVTLNEIQNNADIRRKFLSQYSLLSGDDICATCTNKLGQYYEHYKKLISMNKERNYELYPGKKVWVKSLNMYITNDNLTDEIAEKMLKESPAYAGKFMRMPAIPKKKTVPESVLSFDDVLLSIDGIGKASVKKIKAIHKNKESLLEAIQNHQPTGVGEEYNEKIKEALS